MTGGLALAGVGFSGGNVHSPGGGGDGYKTAGIKNARSKVGRSCPPTVKVLPSGHQGGGIAPPLPLCLIPYRPGRRAASGPVVDSARSVKADGQSCPQGFLMQPFSPPLSPWRSPSPSNGKQLPSENTSKEYKSPGLFQ